MMLFAKKRMKVDQAAREFGVPSQTLRDRVLKTIDLNARRHHLHTRGRTDISIPH